MSLGIKSIDKNDLLKELLNKQLKNVNIEFRLKYSDLKPTPLEISESVDMNRLIEHGFKIKMIRVDEFSHAVDTPQDLLKVEGFMKNLTLN